MTFRSAQSKPMLLPCNSDLENFVCDTQGPESYVTARNLPSQQPQYAEMFPQSGLGLDQTKDGIGQSMEVSEDVTSRFELRSLPVNELNHIGVTPMKASIMQGLEET